MDCAPADSSALAWANYWTVNGPLDSGPAVDIVMSSLTAQWQPGHVSTEVIPLRCGEEQDHASLLLESGPAVGFAESCPMLRWQPGHMSSEMQHDAEGPCSLITGGAPPALAKPTVLNITTS
jgi:hypothetical protein